MSTNFRQRLIALVTFLSGLYFFLEYVLPERIGEFQFNAYHDQISRGFVLVGVMAIGLGLINIFRVHGGAILRGRKGRGNSVALLLGLLIMFWAEGGDFFYSTARVEQWKRLTDLQAFSAQVLHDYLAEDVPAAGRLERMVQFLDRQIEDAHSEESLFSAVSPVVPKELGSAYLSSLTELRAETLSLSQRYHELQANQEPLALTTELALVTELRQRHETLSAAAAVTAEAADRVSRLNYETNEYQVATSLLREGFFFPLGAAMFSLLAFYIATAAYRSFRIRSAEAFIMMVAAVLVTLGQIPHGPLYISPHLPMIRLWLLENLSTPAFRAIFFGSAIAGLAMAVRMWLSLERSPLATEGTE